MWNEWHGAWLKSPVRHVFVRYEEFLFNTEEVTRRFCRWHTDKKVSVLEKSPKHGLHPKLAISSNRSSSISKYLNSANAMLAFFRNDTDFIRENVDYVLLRHLGYIIPESAIG